MRAVPPKYLGLKGPSLGTAYNKVTPGPAQDNLSTVPALAGPATTESKQGPRAFRATVATTKATPKVPATKEKKR